MIAPQRVLAPYAAMVGAITLVGFAVDVPLLWIPLAAFGFAAFVMIETQQRAVVTFRRGWWVRPTAFAAAGMLVVAALWRAGSPEHLLRLESVLVLGMFWVTMPWSLFGAWGKSYGYGLIVVAVVSAFFRNVGPAYDALVVGAGSLAYALVLRLIRVPGRPPASGRRPESER